MIVPCKLIIRKELKIDKSTNDREVMQVYEKVFETLEVIKKETEKCYQELKKECETYKELEKAIRDIEWYGEYGGEFLVELLRYKMEEEKSNLHIIKEGEQCT